MRFKCPHCGYALDQAGGLTYRQAELLKWLRSYDWSSGISPSYDEMCAGTGFASKSGVHRLIRSLAERSFVTFIRKRNRSIKLIKWEQDNGKTAEGLASDTNHENDKATSRGK